MVNALTSSDLDQTILRVISERKPQSLKQLVNIVHEICDLPEKEIIAAVERMKTLGTIRLVTNTSIESSYLWYLLTVAIGTLVIVLVFLVPDNTSPLFLARNLLGFGFVFFLPGYAFAKAVFPTGKSTNFMSERFGMIERTALSVAVSIALVSIVGLILYYTPLHLELSAITVSLFVLTSFLATVGLFRQNKVSKESKLFHEIPSLK